MDTPLIISLSALALSIISPFATAWLNGHNRLKEKRLDIEERQRIRDDEFYRGHRAEVIEDFVRSAMRISQNIGSHSSDILDFGASCGEIYMYIDSRYWPEVDSIIQSVQSSNRSGARASLQRLCKELSAENIRAPHSAVPDNAHK